MNAMISQTNTVLIIKFTEWSVILTDQGKEWSVIPKIDQSLFHSAKLPNSFFVLPITCVYYRCKRPALFHSVSDVIDKQFHISNYCALMQQIFTYIYHNYLFTIASTHVHACDALTQKKGLKWHD